MTTTHDIRQTFLDFFAKNGHTVTPSSPLVPHNDPTLMFTNAGMVPFKNIFTGAEKAPNPPRATSSQKCVRAGGKHNDLDNVGYTARHHTFFEMLGNFSFGDYFKEGAINYAWDLLTKEYKLPKEKLWITVYHTDDEAHAIWKKVTGFEDKRIIRIPTNDNFWAMGDTGPCGPCSEIYYNFLDADPKDITEAGDDCIEIWNLVFMQYEQVDKEKRINLPKPSIDTGMGLERVSSVLQGVRSNYETDLFLALIHASEELTHTKAKGEIAAAHRVIADHLRASCFLMADGVMPSNEGRGYVLRRIMRRAMRYAHQLGCKEPLMHRLVPALVAQMGTHYPELVRAQAMITENLRLEEERFKQTLERGLKLLEEEVAKLPSPQPSPGGRGGSLPGEVAFKLYDTYGFPLDLTQDILRGQKLSVDTAGFEKSMNEQRERARAAWSGSGEKATSRIWFDIKEKVGPTEFLGYTQEAASGNLVAIVAGEKEAAEAASGEAYLIFNQTPFYGESGGQVGDTGAILADGKPIAEVLDTMKPIENFHVHKVKLNGKVKVGEAYTLAVDSTRRAQIRANHSATHILHAVLRKQLGEHITQKGSLVAPDKLRFDISHPKAVTREELASIENEVNRIVWQNKPVSTKLMTPDDAIKAGAMALFGEKYGDEVRVLSIGIESLESGVQSSERKNTELRTLNSELLKPYSVELCGGTHVHATGDIGLFKIISEGAVAAGIRRIEAVTRDGAFAYLAEQDARLKDIAGGLKVTPDKLGERIDGLVEERKKLEKDLADAKKKLAMGGGGGEAVKPMDVHGIAFVAKAYDGLDPKELRDIASGYIKELGEAIVALGTNVEGKASVLVAVSPAHLAKFSAVPLVQAAVATLGGKGGGGKPEMAQGGGPDASKLEDALNAVKAALK